jgi:predicted amidohydrolase
MLFFNRDGEGFQIHRKLIPTYTERLIWGRGDGSTLDVLNTEFGKIGGLICWEHWMPLARAAMHAKNESIHVAQWPAVTKVHQLASRHYAFEGRCFVMAAGCVLSRGDVIGGFHSLGFPDSVGLELLDAIPGDEKELLQRGGSAVIGPDADYVAGPTFDDACILYAKLRPDLITQARMVLDTSGHYARPDIFRLEVKTQPLSSVTFTGKR